QDAAADAARLAARGEPDRAASAEFAVALPALLIVVVLGIGALMAGSVSVRLQDAAADAARLAARGEPDRVAGVVGSAVDGASAIVEGSGELICVTASANVALSIVTVPVWAKSCALDGGL
ncbi:TadE family type IV pilus minor pilin, partial [Microbacterium gubbeenense]|uniref:TadE family type IV pilus minor pilin n=1 Tax=Microbacterium gubbeenense TaxID=159896 RepID=UPI003F9722CF